MPSNTTTATTASTTCGHGELGEKGPADEPEPPEPDSAPSDPADPADPDSPDAEWARVAHGPRGRGVTAARPIPAGTIFERSLVILVPRDEVGDGVVSHYVFLWPGTPDEQPMYALPTGLGMLFNHSPAANADFEPDPASLTILFRSIRPIERGEEILIDYDYAADHLEVLRHPQWYRAARNDSGSSDDQPLSS